MGSRLKSLIRVASSFKGLKGRFHKRPFLLLVFCNITRQIFMRQLSDDFSDTYSVFFGYFLELVESFVLESYLESFQVIPAETLFII